METVGLSPQILLLGHDVHAQQELTRHYGHLGWTFRVLTPEQCVQNKCERLACDVIVTDLSFSTLGLVESLRALRQSNPSEAIIVNRKIDEANDIAALLREGATEVISAVNTSDVLRGALERVVSSLAQRNFERQLFNHVSDASVTYVFKSRDLVSSKVPLPFLDDLYRACRIDLHTRLRIELAFQEALANALEHGNLELPSAWREVIESDGRDKFARVKAERLASAEYGDRQVRIQFELEATSFSIRIHDQGLGFIPKLSAKDSGQSSVQSFGRGTAIIHDAVDEVQYNAQGNEIRMKKHICPGVHVVKRKEGGV
jgi:anti-sigma regulatory factor (Ser/Thr protein kinase)